MRFRKTVVREIAVVKSGLWSEQKMCPCRWGEPCQSQEQCACDEDRECGKHAREIEEV